MSIGGNIRKRRRAKDMTQDQLAARLGVSRPRISQIESGMQIPNVITAQAIATVLGCTVDDLCDDDGTPAAD